MQVLKKNHGKWLMTHVKYKLFALSSMRFFFQFEKFYSHLKLPRSQQRRLTSHTKVPQGINITMTVRFYQPVTFSAACT